VRAHKTGPVVQFRKWVRRNRPLAASLAGILVVLAGAGAWRLDQVRREGGQFRDFLDRARTAQEAGDFDRAIELVSSALTLRPDDPLASERRATYVSDRERRREEEDRRRRDEAEARKREERLAEARAEVEEGRRLIDERRAIAEGLPEKRKRLAEGEAGLKGPEGPDVKRPLWVLEEEIRLQEGRAKDLETRALNAFHGALTLAGAEGLPGAKAALADYWLSRFQEAVAAGEEPEANRLAGQVRLYDEERRHAALLDREGTLTLLTDPPGARAFLFRYVEKEKRLWPVPFDLSKREEVDLAAREQPPDAALEEAAATAPASGYVAPSVYDRLLEDLSSNDLGETPIEGLSLPHGSYLVVLRKEGFVDVRYPVLVRRGGEEGPRNPIRLWRTDEHPDPKKWVYVPEGASVQGGDSEAFDSWDRREPYVEGFFIGRFEVTCAEYAEFLNDPETVRAYREHRQAGRLRLVPRHAPDAQPHDGWIESEGEADSTGFKSGLGPHWPVLDISWEDAIAYVAWLNRRSEETGERWEYALPREEEWERVARGADGRLFPWGDGFDWTFCKGGNSRPEERQNAEAVGVFPADESPFGVRDLAGGVWERCQDAFEEG
ncbi:MAG: SUMF1/EgtB/PvdO family nonheme iron enzyme, partial [Planctomycetes bacterium]|nr:SUMF1/EgtB/PvdO family nonheme iron enzyme [Planctomycetota bacterium]